MSSYNLGGHSGCQIYLIENDESPAFVRKISKDKDYNSRLESQCKKQKNFFGGEIIAPKVIDSGITRDGLFYFDMEYVQGITLAEHIKTMEIGKVRGLVDKIVSNLVPHEEIVVSDEEKESINLVFKNKFNDLLIELKSHNNLTIEKALSLLKEHDWSICTPSNCHGDMTLENIIVKNENIYFIDFLDSFYDSWILDIGTLLQDIHVMWSYRFNQNVDMNTVLRLIVFKDLLLDEIKKINSCYIVEIYYALLQKLIRIYPYTKDEDTYRFLDMKTEMIIHIIEKLEERER